MKKYVLLCVCAALLCMLAAGVSAAWYTTPQGISVQYYSSCSSPGVDSLQVGNFVSEFAHQVQGFGVLEPASHGGYWGNIVAELFPSDRVTRVIYAHNESDSWAGRSAQFVMSLPLDYNCMVVPATTLSFRVLDGQAVDDFVVFWKNERGHWEEMGNFVSNPSTSEFWTSFDVDLSSIPYWLRMRGSPMAFKVVASGSDWQYKSTYGQVAFDYITLR